MSSHAINPLSPEMLAQLEKLKDIRLPQAISWWPLAPGWWMLAGTVLVVTFTALVIIKLRSLSVRYAALRELQALRSDKSVVGSPVELATRINILLRRIVLRSKDGRSIASAESEKWRDFLVSKGGLMSPLIAGFLAQAPYLSPSMANTTPNTPEPKAMLEAAEAWIRRNS